jgi:pimeloyl-ACP methyl ester carboxylesterase
MVPISSIITGERAHVSEGALEPPASTLSVTFDSDGDTLLGVVHLPAGEGPHPLIVVLHGFPGWERNFDVAQDLRRAGYATLVFHYRGSWGSSGCYSFANSIDDAHAVLEAVSQGALGLRVDVGRIALLGHSFGGYIALQVAASSATIRAVVTAAAFDFGAMRREVAADRAAYERYVDDWSGELAPLSGTTAEGLVEEALTGERTAPLSDLAPALQGVPMLLIGTARDDVSPAATHHEPLIAALTAAGAGPLEETIFPTDHALADHRAALAATARLFFDRTFAPS